jgi:hypothetical protein
MKIWWKGEPLIVGSLHWRIIDNDLLQTIRETMNKLKALKNEHTNTRKPRKHW